MKLAVLAYKQTDQTYLANKPYLTHAAGLFLKTRKFQMFKFVTIRSKLQTNILLG